MCRWIPERNHIYLFIRDPTSICFFLLNPWKLVGPEEVKQLLKFKNIKIYFVDSQWCIRQAHTILGISGYTKMIKFNKSFSIHWLEPCIIVFDSSHITIWTFEIRSISKEDIFCHPVVRNLSPDSDDLCHIVTKSQIYSHLEFINEMCGFYERKKTSFPSKTK
jgi:hypothetical protein